MRARVRTERLRTRAGARPPLSCAHVLQLRGDNAAAAATIRDLIDTGLATGRLLSVYYGSYVLVDVLVDHGELVEADAVLARVEQLLEDSDDPQFVGALRVRRARLLRLAGRTEEAVAVLTATEKCLEADAPSPQHLIWLVEHALLADDQAEARNRVPLTVSSGAPGRRRTARPARACP